MELSVNVFLGLDAVMQGPGALDEDPSGGFTRGGWVVPHADADMGRIVDGWFSFADAILLGASTYRMMRAYWSQVSHDDAVARALNTYPKHVVSSTLDDDDLWDNTTVIRGDVAHAVTALKNRPGRELQVHGSWRLARTLHDAGLVDRYRLMYFPVVVGAGKRLFDDGAVPSSFRLVSSETTGAGATVLTLEPAPFHAGDYLVSDEQQTIPARPVD
jgi:dihydrofolate reductase